MYDYSKVNQYKTNKKRFKSLTVLNIIRVLIFVVKQNNISSNIKIV